MIIALLGWALKKLSFGRIQGNDKTNKKGAKASSNEKPAMPNLCPLCQSQLGKGQDLISRVYRPMTVHDQLCTINGCPNCFPSPKPGIQRICPVCHKTVDVKDGHLVARLFNYEDKKKHVIVTGCNHCCRGVK